MGILHLHLFNVTMVGWRQSTCGAEESSQCEYLLGSQAADPSGGRAVVLSHKGLSPPDPGWRELWSWAGLSALPQTEARARGLYIPMPCLSADSGSPGGGYDLGQGVSAEGSSSRGTQLCTVSPQCPLPLGHGDFSSEGRTSDTTTATLTQCYPVGETTV